MNKLPSNWKVNPLHKLIASLESGVSVNSEDRNMREGEVGVLKVSSVSSNVFQPNEYKVVLESELDRVKTNPRKDTILISRANTWDLVGASAYIAKDYPNLYLPDKLWMTSPRTEHSVLWLSYVLQLPRTRYEISRRSSGTSAGMKNISKKDFLEITIPVPPLAEQYAIAAILSTWDKAIALTEALIAALQERKKGLLQKLLTGKVRFSQFVENDGEIQETRFGYIPSDWRLVEVECIANVNAETASEGSDIDSEWFYIDLSSVSKGKIDMPKAKKTFNSLPSRARRILRNGDVIMSTVRPNLLGYAVCDFNAFEILCSTGFALISPHYAIDTQFIYQNLYGDIVQRQIHGMVTGSNYPAINSKEVKKIKIAFPAKSDERESIGNILRSCDTQTEALDIYKAKLQHQKKGLMQKLLTGQVRVKV